MTRLIAALLVGVLALTGGAAISDEVDRMAPDFIHASLIVCGPGGSLYGCAGRAALRPCCPHYDLDRVFSYEGESITNQVLALAYAVVYVAFAPFCARHLRRVVV